MKFEMVQCDECCEQSLRCDAIGWVETMAGDLCPSCADAHAVNAEFELSAKEER